jgi:hypothetical protein
VFEHSTKNRIAIVESKKNKKDIENFPFERGFFFVCQRHGPCARHLSGG